MVAKLRWPTRFVLVLVVLPLSARAETTYVHAGDLYRVCTSNNDINKSWCEGFISSALEIISNTPVEGVTACVPPLMTLQKGVAIAEKWLGDHPDQSVQPASLVVARAFSEAFPCKK